MGVSCKVGFFNRVFAGGLGEVGLGFLKLSAHEKLHFIPPLFFFYHSYLQVWSMRQPG